MARKVFYSFHYKRDHWRAGQVRNIGAIEGNQPASDNDWESVKRGGDTAIQKWIDGQLRGRSCTIVLIGAETAERRWINYEIEKSWNTGKALVGIHVHNLKDHNSKTAERGRNPFDNFKLAAGKIAPQRKNIGFLESMFSGDRPLSQIVKAHDPGIWNDSAHIYRSIAKNLSGWVEEAIAIRQQF